MVEATAKINESHPASRGGVTPQVLFVQGGGEDVHAKWDSKLVASLRRNLGHEYTVRYPKMPNEADPHFSPWRAALRKEFETLEDGDILVGHSIGAAILLHTLAKQPPPFRPGALVLLAAPFIGKGGWPSDEIQPPTELSSRLPANMPVRLYHGTKDEEVPVAHVRLYEEALPHAVVTHVKDADHQLGNDLNGVAADLRAIV